MRNRLKPARSGWKVLRGRRRGFGYLELLASVLLLLIASAGALATWSLSVQTPANKRNIEMGVYLGVSELERLKAQGYLGLPETGPPGNASSNPIVRYYGRTGAVTGYYDQTGALVGGPAARGYRARAWIETQDTNGDGLKNSKDLREVTVEVTDNNGNVLYERVRTLLSFGGV